MRIRSLRIEVDDNTYKILKEQQSLFFKANNRKISFANVIMHYFFEGLENSNVKTDNGLGVIEIPIFQKQNSNNLQNELPGTTNDFQFSIVELTQREERIERKESSILQKENDFVHRERELTKAIFDFSQNQATFNQIENPNTISSRAEISEIKMELNLLKGNKNSDDEVKRELRNISRNLERIENQTKKSTMDLILQFANPLISLVGFFLINNKLKSSTPKLEPILKEIKNIYSKLNKQEKDMISEQFKIDLDEIL